MREWLSAIAMVAVFGICGAQAQTFPVRPVTLVVSFAAGGPLDTVARILSEPMRAALGQSIGAIDPSDRGGAHEQAPQSQPE